MEPTQEINTQTEQTEQKIVQDSHEPETLTPDIDRLIAEAEERGYRRGREEAGEEAPAEQEPADEPEILILAHQRRSIWD